MQLAGAGFPVLRFDYGGTGDSAGEAADADLVGWRDDIRRAADALRERAGVELVCLAGLRLGASLALQLASERHDVAALILWEPIVSGAGYLAELGQQHRELLWRYFDNADRFAASAASEYLGFPVGAQLRSQLERLDLLTLPPARADQLLIVESVASPAVAQLRERLGEAGRAVDYRQIASFATWREDVDKGLVPEPVLRGIAAWAAEVLP
jgi:pimeloyl-ACP methyl ester carboxylesterase